MPHVCSRWLGLWVSMHPVCLLEKIWLIERLFTIPRSRWLGSWISMHPFWENATSEHLSSVCEGCDLLTNEFNRTRAELISFDAAPAADGKRSSKKGFGATQDSTHMLWDTCKLNMLLLMSQVQAKPKLGHTLKPKPSSWIFDSIYKSCLFFII